MFGFTLIELWKIIGKCLLALFARILKLVILVGKKWALNGKVKI